MKESFSMVDEQKPFITIDDVQISIEDLPEEAQGIFGRIQRLNQKKATLALDMEEIDASLNFFSGRIIAIVNADAKPKEEEEEAVKSNN
tara:strand:+ start:1171 stop:1437 length:267 start_codon:yes stop_codon:yes gene_type:complete